MSEVAANPNLRRTAVLIALVCVASLGLMVLTRGNLGLALVPVAAVGVVYLFWRLPLPVSCAAVFCLILGLERVDDAANLYHTPLLPLGLAVTTKIGVLLNFKPLQVTGGDLLLLLLLLVALVRSGTHADVDGRGRVQAARPLAVFAAIFFATVTLAFAHGMLRHGDFSVGLWQLRTLIHVPFYFLIFQACIRGPQDFPLIGRAMVLGASMRATLALWNMYGANLPARYPRLEYMTCHDDSMSFAIAMLILLVALSERTDRRAVLRCALFLPLLVWGTIANNRRLAWVDLGIALLIYAVISPRTLLKRAIQRGILALLPVVALYFVVGWGSQSKVFGPVKLLKSVVSSESDRSALDRDVENWNIATSVHTNILFGRGLGQEYDEKVPMDDISGAFPMYRSFPHNSVLGLWVFFGLFGVSGLWALFAAGMFFGARAYHWSRLPEDRTAAYVSVGAIVIVLSQCYGDMAFWGDIGALLIGMALAVAGKAAVASGAWPAHALPSPYHAAKTRQGVGNWRRTRASLGAR